MKSPERRKFLQKGIITAAGLAAFPGFVHSMPVQGAVAPIDPKIVKEFVGKSHGNFEVVKSLVEEHPNIINATWDWGDGDFENGLGAAGHMGNKEIANFLLEKGARPDIFVLTMLGKTEIVKALINAYPVLLKSPGPHGLTLLHHALKGGEEAEALVEFLKSQGLEETQYKIYKR